MTAFEAQKKLKTY